MKAKPRQPKFRSHDKLDEDADEIKRAAEH